MPGDFGMRFVKLLDFVAERVEVRVLGHVGRVAEPGGDGLAHLGRVGSVLQTDVPAEALMQPAGHVARGPDPRRGAAFRGAAPPAP